MEKASKKNQDLSVALVGVTGAVGHQVLKLLELRKFPLKRLCCFASARSVGQTISYGGEEVAIEPLHPRSFVGMDLAFFCAGSTISREFIPHALSSRTFVIDSSSAFREQAPLIIPEINGDELFSAQGLVSSPNCAATILLMPLAPLHRIYRVKRIVVSTYQAASGAGRALLRELQEETRAYLEKKSYASKLNVPYAFNLFLHQSALNESGYTEEEQKLLYETRKILADESIQVSATCVRVPVLRAHSLSANVEFHQTPSLREAEEAICHMPGVRLFEDRSNNRFPTPCDATGINDVLCGRLRTDPSQPNTLEFWAVGDQLLKGAALNAVQIAETWIKSKTPMNLSR